LRRRGYIFYFIVIKSGQLHVPTTLPSKVQSQERNELEIRK
jgi:hypothetical protein